MTKIPMPLKPDPPLTNLEKKIVAAFPVARERAREFIRGCFSAVLLHKYTVVDVLASMYVWGLRDMTSVVIEHEKNERKKKPMSFRDYDLTDEQHTIVHDTLPKIADLCLMYLISELPRDSYFDAWAGGMIAASDTSSWGDDALGCALIDVGEKYEKFVTHRAPVAYKQEARIRGMLLRAGSLLVSVNNKLIPEKEVAEVIAVAVEKFSQARQEAIERGLTVPA